MCTALYMMVLYDRARVGPTTKTSDEISIICLFRLILQANPLFCFELWYSSCFEVKCWFHTFSKWCSHIAMWILILLDHRVCHLNFFSPVCSSSSGSDHFNISKINYHFFSTVFVSSIPSCLCFPALPPFFFFKDSDFLINYPFIGGSFSILTRWFSRRCSTSSSFFILFLLWWIQFKLSVLIISFPRFKYLLLTMHLIIILLLAICYSGVLKISRRFVFPLCIRSSSFEDVISFKPFNSTSAIPPFNQLFNGVFFWVGPNPQIFFPGSYLTLLIILVLFPNSFQSVT